MFTVTPKLPPLPSASPRPTTTNNTNNPTNPTETEEDLELKSNQTSLASSYNPQTIGLSDAQKHALQLAAPPKRKQPRDMIRKDPPHPDSLMGKAFACYDTYHAQYVDFMNAADRHFTQIAREDAQEAARLLALQHSPPSTVNSPRIDATLEDVIDLCKSHVKRGKVQRLKKLVRDNFIDVNQNSDMYGGWTPLIAAARMGSTSTMQVLINQFEADVNVCEKHGWSPLMFAAYRGHVHTVRYLIEVCKADRYIKCNGRGWTAIQYARHKAYPRHGKQYKKQYKKAEVTEHYRTIVEILSGNTPAQTPRKSGWGVALTFKSMLFNQHKREKIEKNKIARSLCWCVNLEIRCKQCQYKVENITNAQLDQERAEFLQREALEIKRKKRLAEYVAPKGEFDFSSDSDDSSDDDLEDA